MANPEENLDLFKQFFLLSKNKREQILKKKFFSIKLSHIQLNYVFILFWSIFVEILWKLLFLLQKFLSQKETQKVCFSKQVRKRANPKENLDLL